VARLQPVMQSSGADVKGLLRRHRPDRRWAQDLASVRALVELEVRS